NFKEHRDLVIKFQNYLANTVGTYVSYRYNDNYDTHNWDFDYETNLNSYIITEYKCSVCNCKLKMTKQISNEPHYVIYDFTEMTKPSRSYIVTCKEALMLKVLQ